MGTDHSPAAWLVAAALVAGCGSSNPSGLLGPTEGTPDAGDMCPTGDERCPCYGNGTCNAGLTCASGLCVSLGSGAATHSSGGGPVGGSSNRGGAAGNPGRAGSGAAKPLPAGGGGDAGRMSSPSGGAGGSAGASVIPEAGVREPELRDASADGAEAGDGGRPPIIDASAEETGEPQRSFKAFFVMLDRSSSMITGMPAPASPMSWDNCASALTAFVEDPSSRGLDIGLGTFPYGPNNTADCATGTDCGTPVVPIARLPGNAKALVDAFGTQRPGTNATAPTECALRGMINACLGYQAASPTGEPCAAILVTDGTPTACDLNEQNLTAIIADGHAKGVLTYALGLPGTDLGVLNEYAQAGGTNAAFDVSAGTQSILQALDAIRSH